MYALRRCTSPGHTERIRPLRHVAQVHYTNPPRQVNAPCHRRSLTRCYPGNGHGTRDGRLTTTGAVAPAQARRIPRVVVEGQRVTADAPTRRSALLALFAAGFAAGVAQVLLMRELLVVAYGNELSMGVLLACWLLAGALGSLGARAALGAGDRSRSARLMAGLCALPAPLLIASVAVVRAAPLAMAHIAELCVQAPAWAKLLGWLALQPGEMLGPAQILVLGAIAAFGPAALDGAQFAVGCDLYARGRRDEGGVGPVYAADALGHLVGGVLLATAVVLLLDPFTMSLVAAAANVAAAVVLLAAVPGAQRRAVVRIGVAGLIALAVAAIGTTRLHARSLQWRWHNHKLLASIESIFGNLAIVRQEPDGIYLYQSGLYSGASPPLVGTIDELVHFTLLQHERPQRVLMIGGGITGGLREVLKHEPTRITYVELDATLFEPAARWADDADAAALRDPRVETVAADGRRYIAEHDGEPFDAIIIALPDPATAQLNRFYTREFYTELVGALAVDGVVGWEVPGSEGYFGPALLALHRCLVDTARGVFPYIVRMPGESTVCVASRGAELTDDLVALRSRLLERGVEAAYFEAMLSDRLSPATLQTVARALDTDRPAETNTDVRPMGYFLDQTWWLTQFHPSSAQVLERLVRVRARDLLPALAGVFTFLVGLSWLRPVRTGFIALGIGASGFASMTLEVALLFAFQAFYGYVYHMVGVIIGAFMVGIAAGSIGVDRWLQGKSARAAGRALPVGLGAMAAMSLALGVALPAMSRAHLAGPLVALFPLITALVGLVVGWVFPLATHAWARADAARAAAGLYAADLTGAALGAVLTGALLAPVLGLVGTCWLAAAVVAAAAALLVARAALEP